MKNLLKSTLVIAMTVGLAACGSDGYVDTSVPTTLDITGKAVKGNLAFATVNVYAASDIAKTTLLATTQTDANGDYTVHFVGATPTMGSFLIELVADADTTMLCDAVMCGDVERGDPIPASQLEGLTLSTVTYSDGTTIDNVDVNSLTTMATDAIFSAANLEGSAIDLATISAADFLALQNDASEVVGAIIGVDLSESNIFAIDIVDASVSADISTTDSIAATLTLINASLSGLDATGSTLEAEITAYLDAVEEVTSAVLADPDVDLGATNSDALDLVNETQAIISVEVAEIASVVGSEEGGVVLELEEVPTELDEEALSETIGEIISGTGATGGTGAISG